MTERAYTVKEIDRMRNAVRGLVKVRRFDDSHVEDCLRTYLVAGISPTELEEEYRVLGEEDDAKHFAKQRAEFLRRVGAWLNSPDPYAPQPDFGSTDTITGPVRWL